MDHARQAEPLTDRLVGLVAALRSKGVPAGTSETVDAARVAAVLGFDDRELLREGLASALVRRGGQREVFDMTFDLYFPAGVGTPEAARDVDDDVSVEDLRDLLAMALAEGDLRSLEQVAEVAVDALGQVGTPGTQTAGWSAFQTLDRIQPQTTLVSAMSMRSGGGAPGGAPAHDVTSRIERDEVRRLIEAFRQMVAAEARRRTSEVRGRDVVTRHAVRSSSDQVDFLSANRKELEELRAGVRPLARKLATRLAARRRRARRGRIDVRRTMRRAMGTGGVPLRPVFERPRPSRPELVLLCDVSGSVAGFSGFTMLLVRALSDQFTRIRVFAFVNAMAEVTDIVKESDDPARAIADRARVTKWHTSSDYGEAFGDFAEHFLDAVGPRTSVLVLGDARNNNLSPNLEALHRVGERAKRIFWLNPEHENRWGLGDSIAPEYAEVVPMYECATVEQLSRFVSRLLPV
ncbi:VWA domain-containing protein [Aeromicrobium halocynthiae]|uniref:VWA domain-containing protein n=1 Tax=Aeromicrobium halocynthiae TaxID=560557 RepID=A0ABP5HFN0_9ACTN